MARRTFCTDKMEDFRSATPAIMPYLDRPDADDNPFTALLVRDLTRAMKQACLTDLQKVVLLCWMSGMSQYDIAAKLGRRRSTIQNVLTVAKVKLECVECGTLTVLVETFGIDAIRTLDDG